MSEGLSVKRLLVVATTAIAAVLLGGCGAAGAKSSGEGLSVAAVRQAAGAVDAATRMPAFTMSGDARFAARQLAGRTIWVVNSSSTDSFAVGIQEGVSAAASRVGLAVRIVNGQGSAEVQDQGVLEAVGAHASAIIVDAAALQVLSTGLASAAAAHIPVIDVAVSVPHGPHPLGDYQHIAVPYPLTGRLMADYIVAHLRTAQPMLALFDNEYSSVAARDGAALAVFDAECGRCDVVHHEVPFATLGSTAPSTIVSLIERVPGIHWIFSAYDAQAVDAVAAVKAAGDTRSVKVVSADGSAPNLANVQSGGVEVADVGEPAAWMGWAAVDAAMRAILRLPKVEEVIPVRLFNRADLKGVNVNSQTALFGGAYVTGFLKLWEIA